MESLYLHTHTQFGDHCICFGLVSELSKKYEKIYLFTKPSPQFHVDNIKRLYRSISNVQIITENPKNYTNVFSIGWDEYFDMIYNKKQIIPFDIYFYQKANVPFNLKWDNFYFERDPEKEKDIFYNKLKLQDGEQFIFLQEDHTRKFIVDRNLILSRGCKILESSKILDISILDLLYTIERATEVHVINSSFLSFIDLMQIKHDNLFYHKYTRPRTFEQPTLKLKWKILEKN